MLWHGLNCHSIHTRVYKYCQLKNKRRLGWGSHRYVACLECTKLGVQFPTPYKAASWHTLSGGRGRSMKSHPVYTMSYPRPCHKQLHKERIRKIKKKSEKSKCLKYKTKHRILREKNNTITAMHKCPL